MIVFLFSLVINLKSVFTNIQLVIDKMENKMTTDDGNATILAMCIHFQSFINKYTHSKVIYIIHTLHTLTRV